MIRDEGKLGEVIMSTHITMEEQQRLEDTENRTVFNNCLRKSNSFDSSTVLKPNINSRHFIISKRNPYPRDSGNNRSFQCSSNITPISTFIKKSNSHSSSSISSQTFLSTDPSDSGHVKGINPFGYSFDYSAGSEKLRTMSPTCQSTATSESTFERLSESWTMSRKLNVLNSPGKKPDKKQRPIFKRHLHKSVVQVSSTPNTVSRKSKALINLLPKSSNGNNEKTINPWLDHRHAVGGRIFSPQDHTNPGRIRCSSPSRNKEFSRPPFNRHTQGKISSTTGNRSENSYIPIPKTTARERKKIIVTLRISPTLKKHIPKGITNGMFFENNI